MQDIIIDTCETGLVVVGGAGGAHSTGQGVGSLLLVDALIANTPNGIITSLLADNSTSFLMQNVGFFNVKTAVQDNVQKREILAGGNEVLVDNWGFGHINNATGESSFVSGAHIPAANRTSVLLGNSYNKMKPNFFTRRRPKYHDVPASRVMNVKAFGAQGDGKTDDTAVLNGILEGAANTSSIVYFPFGVYLVRDTLKVPIGSRIIGQAWSQIMATGAKFEDEDHPRAAFQVGRPGDVGIIEIQDMLFTVSGPTAGAILVEWNVQESSQGSVGMWDSHFRVGGAIGSNLQKKDCPKLTGSVNNKCKASSLMMHLAPQSTAYLENVWAWVADHDLDTLSQDQIDVYSGRGILIESRKAWLWGTASEHSTLYQYQLSNAKNILMAMIQTESPYFQPAPKAPQPFKTGLFPHDPTFTNCTMTDTRCAVSWAVRLIDSTSVFILGSGLYSWFNQYSQECLKTEDCQTRGFDVQNSTDIWVYNLCTKGMIEMVSPLNTLPTYARENINGFLSSILAWLQGAKNTSGRRKFNGFQLYTPANLRNQFLSEPCRAALTASIICEDHAEMLTDPSYHGSLESRNLTDAVCDAGCGESIKTYYNAVESNCQRFNVSNQVPTLLGGRLWAGFNETCVKDVKSDQYCNDIIESLPIVTSIREMARGDLCSYCYVKRMSMMQQTSYSGYNEFYKNNLEYINSACGLSLNTTIPLSLAPPQLDVSNFCNSGNWYTTSGDKETCDSIALTYNLSSAAIYNSNQHLHLCSSIPGGTKLCLPPSCARIYTVKKDDTCWSIEDTEANHARPGAVQRYNPWINFDCTNINATADVFGTTLCLAPQNGVYKLNQTNSHVIPPMENGYAKYPVPPPPQSEIAPGTTKVCGQWHEVVPGDTCATICSQGSIDVELFLAVNPSLGKSTDKCTDNLLKGKTYCTGPTRKWNWDVTTTTSSAISTPTPTGSWQSMGCYQDNYPRTSRTLQELQFYNNQLTAELCQKQCLSKTYILAGLENGEECWCGNEILAPANNIITTASECSKACPGNNAQSCGAGGRINLYKYKDHSKGWVSRGCYKDTYPVNDRTLKELQFYDNKLTVEKCQKQCQFKGFSLAGLENGEECWCGNDIQAPQANTPAVDNASCSKMCPGDDGNKCGAGGFINIYEY